MKTLRNHTIIYDDECPLCNLYTSAFVKSKMLDEDGRQAFTKMNREHLCLIEYQKACDEIALIDVNSKKVFYGVDSLFEVIGHSCPIFKPLFGSKLFRHVAKKLYAFISYNRKVIIPGTSAEEPNTCTPTFNLTYRIAYIVFAWLITSTILSSFASLLVPFVPSTNFYREFIICGGQILFQFITINLLKKEKVVHYLGNLMTVSLGGSLLLLPALSAGKFGLVSSPLFFVVWFFFVVSLMLFEHARRVKLLRIHWSASMSWIIYRVLVLIVILHMQ